MSAYFSKTFEFIIDIFQVCLGFLKSIVIAPGVTFWGIIVAFIIISVGLFGLINFVSTERIISTYNRNNSTYNRNNSVDYSNYRNRNKQGYKRLNKSV